MDPDDRQRSMNQLPPTSHPSSYVPAISGILRRRPPTLPPGPLIGRDADLTRLRNALSTPGARVVSILGPGGVGKTRLAMTAAHEFMAGFDGGVLFVRLDHVATDSLGEAIGRHMALTPPEGASWDDVVINALHRQRFLLVLDNCESMLDAMDTLPLLLERCPHLSVLTTSRETLQLPEEHEVWLQPLRVPGTGAEQSVEALRATPAVNLFALRARQVCSGFTVTPDNMKSVREIVQKLDGLPLAIELAAAYLRHLSPGDVLGMLNEALPALQGGSRSLPERHQSLRTMVRWSLDMLPASVRTETLRLAIFPGSFTPESVATVIDSHALPNAWNLLMTLADKSIVVRANATEGTETLFSMLQTIRSVVREELEASPDLLAETLQRRARALAALAREADHHYHGPEGIAWLRRMRQHHADVRMIIDEGLTRPDLHPTIIELCGDMFWFWYTQGQYVWALPRIETLLDRAGKVATPVHRARAHVTAGWLAHRMAQIERAERHFTAARELFGPDATRGSLHGNIGYAYVLSFDRRDMPGAIRTLEDVVAQAPGVENAWHEEAAGHFGIGILRYFDGMYADARSHFTETVRLGRAHNDAQSIGMSLMYLAHVDRAEGAPADAFWKLREALPLLMEIGDLATAALLLDIVAATLAELEADQLATEALAVGEHLRMNMGIPRSPLEQPDADALRDRLNARRQTGDGQDMSIDLGTTIDRLLRFRPEAYAALENGRDAPDDDATSPAQLTLSPRELEVLQLVARGMTSPEIAATLFVSPHTVKRHMANIRDKLGVRSQAAAVAALREGT